MNLTAEKRAYLRREIDRRRREQVAPTPAAAHLDAAESFLREALARGERVGVDVVAEAKKAGLSGKSLRRAKATLRVASRFDPARRRWTWRLPDAGDAE